MSEEKKESFIRAIYHKYDGRANTFVQSEYMWSFDTSKLVTLEDMRRQFFDDALGIESLVAVRGNGYVVVYDHTAVEFDEVRRDVILYRESVAIPEFVFDVKEVDVYVVN